MTRAAKGVLILLLALPLAGCPNDLGKNLNGVSGLVAPAALQGSPDGDVAIRLTWEDQATSESGYRLEVGSQPFNLSPASDYVLLPRGCTTTSYSSWPGRSYYFRIFAVTDTMESDPSNEIIVTMPEVLPGRPTITAVSADWSIVNVSWSEVSGETSFQMELSEDGGVWKPLALFIPADFRAAAFVPTPGVSLYQIRIYAVGPYGNSPPSDVWTVPIPPKSP